VICGGLTKTRRATAATCSTPTVLFNHQGGPGLSPSTLLGQDLSYYILPAFADHLQHGRRSADSTDLRFGDEQPGRFS